MRRAGRRSLGYAFLLLALVAFLFGGPAARAPESFHGAPAERTDPERLRDLADDVSHGRRSAEDLRAFALELVERSAFAARAVNRGGLGLASGAADSGPPPLVATWRLMEVINGGQSLSTAYDGGPCLSTTQPYANVYMCDSTGLFPYDGGATSGAQYFWAPFQCGTNSCGNTPGIRTDASIPYGGLSFEYPLNVVSNSPAGELVSFAAANGRTRLALAEGYGAYPISSTDIGIPGIGIGGLVKNAATYNAYAATLYDVAVNTALTQVTISAATVGNPTPVTTATAHHLLTGNKIYITGATGMTELDGYYVATVLDATHFTVPVNSTHAYTGGAVLTSSGVKWVLWTHGEADAQFTMTTATYQTTLMGLLANYQTDLSAITGQTEAIALIASPQESIQTADTLIPFSNHTSQALYGLIGTANFYESGAKHQFTFCTNCGPHPGNTAYRLIGEKYAQVEDSVEQGHGWLPLYATHATVSGGTAVTVTHHVPVGCLAKDTVLTAPHTSGPLSLWAGALGYEAADMTGLSIAAMTGNGVSPIEVTTGQSLSANGVATGDTLCPWGYVNGNTAANVCTTVTLIDDTHYTMDGTTGNGTYAGFQLAIHGIVALLPISSASISSCTQVSLTLGRAAVTQLVIGYAEASDVYAGSTVSGESGCNGQSECGLLKDQDTYTGASGTTQPNYLVPFWSNVPFSIAGSTRGASGFPALAAAALLAALRRRRPANDVEREDPERAA